MVLWPVDEALREVSKSEVDTILELVTYNLFIRAVFLFDSVKEGFARVWNEGFASEQIVEVKPLIPVVLSGNLVQIHFEVIVRWRIPMQKSPTTTVSQPPPSRLRVDHIIVSLPDGAPLSRRLVKV